MQSAAPSPSQHGAEVQKQELPFSPPVLSPSPPPPLFSSGEWLLVPETSPIPPRKLGFVRGLNWDEGSSWRKALVDFKVAGTFPSQLLTLLAAL